ncbi:hypothetical protein [Roseobacter sp.]|uniref:hypothetical protein n=1 Tax=Roseobacter sp. TaxID=1907202 RepID=UPI003299AD40
MYSITIKTVLAATTVIALAGLTPTQSSAKEYDLCHWDEIPATVLDRIEYRADFGEILERMFANCPASALALTDRPTAAINDNIDNDTPRADADGDSNNPGGGDNGGDNGGDDGGAFPG